MKKFKFACSSHLHYNIRLIYKLLTVVTVTIAACNSSIYVPARSQSTSESGYKELLEGREIYINKCGSCHSLIIPDKYDAKDWNKWVETMGPKAKLSDKEKHMILKYLAKDVDAE